MKPTVGRVVHYYQDGLNINGIVGGPYLAHVTQVWGDGTGYINLLVQPPVMDSFHAGSIAEAGKPLAEGHNRRWSWPPRE